MDIFFHTKHIQKICCNEKTMRKQLGRDRAQKLKQRLMELSAADVLSDISHLPPPRLHELRGREKGLFSVDLQHPYRLLFVPADEPLPAKEDGGVNLWKVKSIEIIAIRDTH